VKFALRHPSTGGTLHHTKQNHGLTMMLFWFMWVGLVLGGLIASLRHSKTWHGKWFQLARARADKAPPVWQRPLRGFSPLDRGGGLAPPGSGIHPAPHPRTG